jgi:xanthine dehydrogenase YagR molybdenum-binding subunit
MGTTWPKKRHIIGSRVARVDGPDQVSGRARYSADINRTGMLHAMVVRCPLAHAKIDSLDVTGAEQAPGVKAVHIINDKGKELYYAGDEVLAIAADTEEHCRDALRAVIVKYTPLPFLVKEEDALKTPALKTVSGAAKSNVAGGIVATKGNVDEGFKQADKVVTAEYRLPVICHQCPETHGLVAEWENDRLTVWCSTQAVVSTAQQLAAYFKIPGTQVKCITQHMGGGFGSKFGPDIQGIVCAELARKAKAPVKLMLERTEEVTTAGNRPSVYGKVKIGGNQDGTITAYEVDCHGTPGERGGPTVNLELLPYVYLDAIPNWKRKHTVVRLNAGIARAMRSPAHPQNCMLTESAVDDLAAALGIDPLVIRLKNIPPDNPKAAQDDPTAWLGQRNTIYRKQLEIAVKLSDWKNQWHPPGQRGKGPIKHGIGMALHTWGGSAVPNLGNGEPANDATVIISRDGSVTVQSSTQDIGTGQRTVSAIVAAEILGQKVTDIVTRIGESSYGRSSGSGGSTTCASQAPATLRAAVAARDAFFAKLAPKLQCRKEDLAIEEGKVVDRAGKKSYDWKKACAMLGMDDARATSGWSSSMANEVDRETGKLVNPGVSNIQVGGVQVAEVLVDIETGLVRCTNFVAVQDCGLIINRLACESQVAGGVIMGISYALFEERIMDRHTGRQVNADMEFYKLGGIQDMPRIKVHLLDMPERGVIGIEEPPTISTCAAVGNAVHNALGLRVPHTPFSPAAVLDALARK